MNARSKRSLAAALLSCMVACPLPALAGSYEVVFRDEFDYCGMPDPEKWTYDEGTGRNGWGNGEAQYYTSSGNAWVDGECLVIEARKEQRDAAEYTSAKLITKGLHEWKEGIVEVRAKLPVGKGTWSAIWLLPEDKRYGGWVDSGEIDLVEYVGCERGIVYTSLHTHENNSSKKNPITESLDLEEEDEDFHIYVLEWTQDVIIVYVDNEELLRYKRPEASPEEAWKTWPFDLPFYLIMNVAVGGSWGGYMGIDDDCFPQRMMVDYVRVYQESDG